MLRRKVRAHGWLRLACLIGVIPSTFAAINEPTPLGPDGGTIYKLAFHPTNGSIAYAGTAAGFYRSADGGLTWTLTSGVPRDHIYDFAVDPNNGDRVFIPLINRWALHVTTDAGLSSSAIATFPRVNWGPSSIEISADGTMYVVGEDRLFRSVDSGQTWDERVAPQQPMYVNSLRVDPLDANSLFVINAGAGFRSADGGATWVAISFPDVTRDLIIPAQRPQHLYAATLSGVMVSSNGGLSWASAGMPSSASTLAMDPTKPDVLYAGVSPTGLWRTANLGGLWRNVHGDARSGAVDAIAINPTDPSVILLGGNEGLARSSTSGTTWVSANGGIQAMRIEKFVAASGSNRIYLHSSDSGVFVLEPGATRALPVNTAGLAALSSALSPHSFDLLAQGGASDRLYVGMNGGIAWSANGGAQWNWSNGPSPGAVSHLAASPLRPEVILARTSEDLYRSIDSGVSWSLTSGLPADSEVTAIAYAQASQSVAYSAARTRALPPNDTTEPLGIYKSVDGGANWFGTDASMPMGFVFQIEVDSNSDRTAYAASELGVFRTLDGGDSWSALTLGPFDPPSYSITSLSLDAHRSGTIYVAYSGRIVRSTDAGESWEEIFVPVNASEHVWRVFADPFRDRTILASTALGAFELTPGTDIQIEAAVPSAVPHGHTAAYAYIVRNLGPLLARDVRTVIQLPAEARNLSASTTAGACEVEGASVTCTQNVLLAGRATQINLTAIHSDRGAIELLATAESAEPDPHTANNSARSEVQIDQVADLSVIASAPAELEEGSAISYSIGIANSGPQDAADVVARVQLAGGLALTASTHSQGSCTSGASGLVTCSLGSLPSASSAAILLTTSGTVPGTYQTTVVVSASGSDPDASNNAATVQSVISPIASAIPPAASTPITPGPVQIPTPNRGGAPSGGASGGGGGGGGSTSLYLLGALLYLLKRRIEEHLVSARDSIGPVQRIAYSSLPSL